MKKILCVMIMLVFSVSSAFAADPAPPVKAVPGALSPQKAKSLVKRVVPAAAIKNFQGKVASVSKGDPKKGTGPEIVIAGARWQKLTVIVKPTTAIIGIDKKPLSLDDLKKNTNVTVRYMTKDKVNEAVAVNCSK